MARLFRFVVLPILVVAEIAVIAGMQFWLKTMPHEFLYGFSCGMVFVLACFVIAGSEQR